MATSWEAPCKRCAHDLHIKNHSRDPCFPFRPIILECRFQVMASQYLPSFANGRGPYFDFFFLWLGFDRARHCSTKCAKQRYSSWVTHVGYLFPKYLDQGIVVGGRELLIGCTTDNATLHIIIRLVENNMCLNTRPESATTDRLDTIHSANERMRPRA